MLTFKIVRKNGEYLSSIGKSDYALRYEIGKTTYARIGKIYCFKFLEDVKTWMESDDFQKLKPAVRNQFFVIRGEAENLTKPKGVAYVGVYKNINNDIVDISTLALMNSRYIEQFWNAKASHHLTNAFPPPKNTYTCDSFTPFRLSERQF